jgi:hypothetical protein
MLQQLFAVSSQRQVSQGSGSTCDTTSCANSNTAKFQRVAMPKYWGRRLHCYCSNRRYLGGVQTTFLKLKDRDIHNPLFIACDFCVFHLLSTSYGVVNAVQAQAISATFIMTVIAIRYKRKFGWLDKRSPGELMIVLLVCATINVLTC